MLCVPTLVDVLLLMLLAPSQGDALCVPPLADAMCAPPLADVLWLMLLAPSQADAL